LSPSDNLSDNVLNFIKTLDYLRGQKIKPFIVYAGTITQVGIVDGLLINEDLKDEPRTFYDLGKLTAEKYLLQYIEEGWLEGCSIRLPNVFGAVSIQQSKNRGIIDKLLRDALVGKNLEIYGEGNWVRDYLYIDDVTAALEITLLKKNELNGKYFCIGTGEATSLLNAFQKIVNIVGESTGNYVDIIKINIPKNSSKIDFRNSVVDSRKFINATNWSAKYTLEKGLRKCLLTIES